MLACIRNGTASVLQCVGETMLTRRKLIDWKVWIFEFSSWDGARIVFLSVRFVWLGFDWPGQRPKMYRMLARGASLNRNVGQKATADCNQYAATMFRSPRRPTVDCLLAISCELSRAHSDSPPAVIVRPLAQRALVKQRRNEFSKCWNSDHQLNMSARSARLFLTWQNGQSARASVVSKSWLYVGKSSTHLLYIGADSPENCHR